MTAVRRGGGRLKGLTMFYDWLVGIETKVIALAVEVSVVRWKHVNDRI